MAVRPDALAVYQIPQLQIGQRLGLGYRVQRIAGGAEHGAELCGAFPERLHRVQAVVEEHAGERLVDPVVEVVASLPVPVRLADDLC